MEIEYLPLRHHSIRGTYTLFELFKNNKYDAVFLEEPINAEELIEAILDDESKPPFALFSYNTSNEEDKDKLYSISPVAEFSPEYNSVVIAKQYKIPIYFVDLPTTYKFVNKNTANNNENFNRFEDELKSNFDIRSHEEFWQKYIESVKENNYQKFMIEFGNFSKSYYKRDETSEDYDLLREVHMAKVIKSKSVNFDHQKILVITGAAHTKSIENLLKLSIEELEKKFSSLYEKLEIKEIDAKITLIPFSYKRLSNLWGYQSGILFPEYYRKVWEFDGDFEKAALYFLSKVQQRLFSRGYDASQAHTQEAFILAKNLATLRKKKYIQTSEIYEAARTNLSKGKDLTDDILTRLLIGEKIGSVTRNIKQTLLQKDFFNQIDKLGIPLSDEPNDMHLDLRQDSDLEISNLLHGLKIIDVSFGQLMGFGDGKSSQGNITQKSIFATKEYWRVQWSPQLEISLIEKSAEGTSIKEVIAYRLNISISKAEDTKTLTKIFFEVVVSGMKEFYENLLKLINETLPEDNDYLSKMSALVNLYNIYKFSKINENIQEDILNLIKKIYINISTELKHNINIKDKQEDKTLSKLIEIVDISKNLEFLDKNLFLNSLKKEVEKYNGSEKFQGLATMILLLSKDFSKSKFENIIEYKFTNSKQKNRLAEYISGLTKINKIIVLKNKKLIKMINNLLQSLNWDEFKEILPTFRKAFSGISKYEADTLSNNIKDSLSIRRNEKPENILDENILSNLNDELSDII